MNHESRTRLTISRQKVKDHALKARGLILRAGLEPVPTGLIEPRFAELNIKDKDRLSELARQALEKAGCSRERRLSLAIPRKATRTFIVGLDEAPRGKKELAEILGWKVERLLEVSMSDLTVAFQRLQPSTHASSGQERYLVVAAVNNVLASYEDVLAPLKIQPGLVMPVHLAETALLALVPGPLGSIRVDKGQRTKDYLLITAEPEELTLIFLRGGDVLSIRSVPGAAETLCDELHRTLVYYLDKLAPGRSDGREAGPEPQLETVLLIGAQLSTNDVEDSCRILFPEDHRPSVHTLRQTRLEDHEGLTLEAIASAAGLAAMGL